MASLVETHIHAIYVGSEFVHVPAPILMADPRLFLRLIGSYQVTYTFAPHFFLSRLLRTLTTTNTVQDGLDISCLRRLVSGGESNTIDTVVALTRVLQGYNLQSEVIRPGFGMTETCAGSIYSKACPSYDVARGNPFASLGKPIPGIQMQYVLKFSLLKRNSLFNLRQPKFGNLRLNHPLKSQRFAEITLSTSSF